MDQQTQKYIRALTELINGFLDKREGIPRPIIGLNKEMPFFLPVRQAMLKKIMAFAREHEDEFEPPVFEFLVNPYRDPTNRRSVSVAYPYKEFGEGEVVSLDADGGEVKLARVLVKDVPDTWKSERPLDLLIQGRAKNKRYGEAIAGGDVVNLRVPRKGIAGKASGV